MPGIENLAPERHETSSGLEASPNRLPVGSSMVLERCLRSAPTAPSGNCSSGVEVGVACLGGDREARWHRDAEPGHVAEIGALASEEAPHRVPVAANVLLGRVDLVEP